MIFSGFRGFVVQGDDGDDAEKNAAEAFLGHESEVPRDFISGGDEDGCYGVFLFLGKAFMIYSYSWKSCIMFSMMFSIIYMSMIIYIYLSIYLYIYIYINR